MSYFTNFSAALTYFKSSKWEALLHTCRLRRLVLLIEMINIFHNLLLFIAYLPNWTAGLIDLFLLTYYKSRFLGQWTFRVLVGWGGIRILKNKYFIFPRKAEVLPKKRFSVPIKFIHTTPKSLTCCKDFFFTFSTNIFT